MPGCQGGNISICMKTSVEIDNALYRQARLRAAEDGTTLRALIEAGLRSVLQAQAAVPDPNAHLAARLAAIRVIQDRFAAAATLDPRSDDEILGYDENGGFS